MRILEMTSPTTYQAILKRTGAEGRSNFRSAGTIGYI